MEYIHKKVKFFKAGGTASKNAKRCSLDLPAKWVREMNITEAEKEILLSFDGEQIIIRKDIEK